MPKKDIHPTYFSQAQFICTTCENKITCGTTKSEEVRVDICSNCHPLYTGNQQFANSAGRAEQFKAKFAKQSALKSRVEENSKAQKAKNAEKKSKKN